MWVEGWAKVHGRVEKIGGRRGQPDARTGEERGNQTGKVVIAHGSVEFCEVTPISLADESKESLYGRETTETCVTPTCLAPRQEDGSRDLFIYFPNEQRGGGEEGVRCQTFIFIFFLFSRPRVSGVGHV